MTPCLQQSHYHCAITKNSNLSGCSKRFKGFSRMTDGDDKSKGNFSGFLRNLLRARDSDEHIRTANLVKVASCEADRKQLESDGSRWSELFRDRKSTRLNSSHMSESRMPSSA